MTSKLDELAKLRADRAAAVDMADNLRRTGAQAEADAIERHAVSLSVTESLFHQIHQAPLHRENLERGRQVANPPASPPIDANRFPHLARYAQLLENDSVAASIFRSVQAFNIAREQQAFETENELPPAA